MGAGEPAVVKETGVHVTICVLLRLCHADSIIFVRTNFVWNQRKAHSHGLWDLILQCRHVLVSLQLLISRARPMLNLCFFFIGTCGLLKRQAPPIFFWAVNVYFNYVLACSGCLFTKTVQKLCFRARFKRVLRHHGKRNAHGTTYPWPSVSRVSFGPLNPKWTMQSLRRNHEEIRNVCTQHVYSQSDINYDLFPTAWTLEPKNQKRFIFYISAHSRLRWKSGKCQPFPENFVITDVCGNNKNTGVGWGLLWGENNLAQGGVTKRTYCYDTNVDYFTTTFMLNTDDIWVVPELQVDLDHLYLLCLHFSQEDPEERGRGSR